MKTVTAAADLGIEVGQLADATGLSTEAASRWLEVGADMGVGADKIAGLIEKMTLNLGKSPAQFKALGIEVQHAADGTADMNATLLLAIDRLDGIKDPTEKAKVAASLFGKSWADAAELVGLGADKVKEKLADVSDAKLFDSKKVAEAREFRDQMENLKDVGEDLAMTIGKELLPQITGLVKGIVALKGPLDDLDGLYSKATGGGSIFAGSLGAIGEQYDAMGESIRGVGEEMQANHDALNTLTDDTFEARLAAANYQDGVDAAAAATVRMSGDTRDAKDAMTGLAGEVAGATREMQTLKGEIDDEQAWLDMLDTLDDYKLKMNDATASDREKQRAGLAVQEELIGRLEAIENLPPEKTTEILTLIDQGKYDEAAWAIGVLTAERTINLKFGQIGPMPHLPGQKLASGTNSARPGVALVGEEGPELVIFKGGESVIPADRTAQMAANAQGDAGIAARAAAAGSGSGNTYNVTVNGANMSADDIVRAIKEWERRNGTGWRS